MKQTYYAIIDFVQDTGRVNKRRPLPCSTEAVVKITVAFPRPPTWSEIVLDLPEAQIEAVEQELVREEEVQEP